MQLSIILLILACGVINCVRGRGWLNKFVCYGLMALFLTGIAYEQGVVPSLSIAIQLWCVAMAGYTYGYLHCWGKYFPTLIPTYNETCEPLVDNITTRIYGPYTSTTPDPQVLNWKTIAMSLRFMIYFSPLFIGVGAVMVFLGTDVATVAINWLVTVLLLALAGPIYRICFYVCGTVVPAWAQYNVAMSEIFIGIMLGTCATQIT